jgi:hypothetical protein
MASSGAAASASGLASTLLWMLFSSALIIANKRVYAAGFAYPMLVTGLGQIASAFGGFAMAWGSGRRSRALPPLAWILPTIGPLWGFTFLTMWLGNAAYLHLSVAFIQVRGAWTARGAARRSHCPQEKLARRAGGGARARASPR